MYLVAIIDLYCRYIVGQSHFNTMTSDWCKECLDAAIHAHGKPEIINTDQGSQFTSTVFIEFVTDQDIKFSMDGKGLRVNDLVTINITKYCKV